MKLRNAMAAGALLCLATACNSTTAGGSPRSGASPAAAFCADYAQWLHATAAAASDPNWATDNAFANADAKASRIDAEAVVAGDPFETDINQGKVTGSMGPAQQDCATAGYGSDF